MFGKLVFEQHLTLPAQTHAQVGRFFGAIRGAYSPILLLNTGGDADAAMS
jgi:hypothetical protein